MLERLNDLWEKVDGVLITSPYNLRYFTGFCGGEGVALMGEKFKYLFVDSRYTTEALSETEGFNVIEISVKNKIEELRKAIEENAIKALGFEEAFMCAGEYGVYEKIFSDIEWASVSTDLIKKRMVKTEEEISYLRKAEEIGVSAFKRVLPLLKVGVTENDIAAEIEYQMRRLGASGTSFETIVVSGKKSSMPHGRPSNKEIEYGDFVTMDFGCRFNGYCSDMTRTVVAGKATDEQKKIYETVREAQEAGLLAIRAGVKGKDADKAARDIIEKAGYGEFFGHSLGHGTGLEIHELPNLSPMSEITLEKGMVVTCEPGIYIPDLGGVRIEDMVVVTDDGIENLTNLSKELLEIV